MLFSVLFQTNLDIVPKSARNKLSPEHDNKLLCPDIETASTWLRVVPLMVSEKIK